MISAAFATVAACCTVSVGESVEGRDIRAFRVGDRGAERTALVVGSMHGDEPAGVAVTRALRSRRFADADVWLVDTVNPDGLRRGQRQNARGVDLNRNFPYRWRRAFGRYDSGPKPLSEPESRAVRKLVRRIQPDVSIWYHQPWGHVVIPAAGSKPARRYGRIARFPARKLTGERARLRGTVVSWQNHRFPGTSAFVVELGSGALTAGQLRRHVRAAARVAAG